MLLCHCTIQPSPPQRTNLFVFVFACPPQLLQALQQSPSGSPAPSAYPAASSKVRNKGN